METLSNKVDKRRRETQRLYKAWINKDIAKIFDDKLKENNTQFKSWLQDNIIKYINKTK